MSLSGRMLRHDGAVGAVGVVVPGGEFMGAALAEWETEWGGISKGGSGWRGGMEIWSGEIDRYCMWPPSIPPHKVLPVRTSEPQVETQVWGVWGEREWGAVQLVRWDRRLLHVAAVDSASQDLAGLSLLRKQRWRRWDRGVRLCVFEKKVWLTLLGLTTPHLTRSWRTWPQA